MTAAEEPLYRPFEPAGEDTHADLPPVIAPVVPDEGRLSSGRLSVVGALREDPLWPTRLSVPTLLGAVRGYGRPLPLPPGPAGLPVVGSFFELRRDPFELISRGAATYGDMFRIPMPLLDMVAVTHPDLLREFMDDADGRYSRYDLLGPLLKVIGANSIMLEGPKLRERRKMLMPMFTRRHLTTMADVFCSEFDERLAGWSSFAGTGQPVDLQYEISLMTLKVYLKTLFSASIGEQELRRLDADMRAITGLLGLTTLMVPFPNLLPRKGRSSLLPALARIYRLVGRLIKDRKKHPSETPDFLDTLLDARYEDGSPINRADLAAEIVGLLGGAYDPTGAALTWTVALLLKNPDSLTRLYGEVDALNGALPNFDDVSRLSWTKACFDEGQRMQGHPFFPRFCMADNELGGYRLPKLTLVGASMSVVHRDPRWWPEPDRFDPMRFLDPEQVRARPRLAFMPFSSGQHFCLGTTMAYMAAQFFLTMLFQRFRLSVPDGWQPEPQFTFSVMVKGGLPAVLTRA
ncbi:MULTISPECIES: cytochrome P450 [Mycobacterium]|uniref:Cytochrome P450 n=1 Tax=Mycobacterium kiyosense TaxID=2871094 RepID=A0A9P3Q629_9MYCO|nr:cytochrome P450 [Mycobacterium kiyosense]BDE12070.1 putative cytochrome P450 [Mycobacterium sp. 20KCMC460]BDB40246.1 putative cytochrome P450 [Mycobacterium kiyosense]GLB83714.1 putative cytochrome P450 [Mycobacterium kiyosense]GLB88776.1 putative cytochrome P450 [Mycobacterium kiyosense]GLB96365.1 putative cytochrome P450 [Mycobacterium kiyosense]